MCNYVRFSTMSNSKRVSSSKTEGYEPQMKKHKLLTDADRADTYLVTHQPGRVKLTKMSWLHENRGGHGILPFHVHDIAYSICTEGTSARRYNVVRLVEVPESAKKMWLAGNKCKASLNPLLANFGAMSHNGQLYATLCCTHFVEACKLILEGGRRYNDQDEGLPFRLRDDDAEGLLIQEHGVQAVVYSTKLWNDPAALLALMRENNGYSTIANSETELDAFGHVSRIVI